TLGSTPGPARRPIRNGGHVQGREWHEHTTNGPRARDEKKRRRRDRCTFAKCPKSVTRVRFGTSSSGRVRVRLEAPSHHHRTGDDLFALVKRRLVRGDRHEESAV